MDASEVKRETALTLGIQVLGRAFDEETVFAAARVLEQAAKFELRP